MKRQPILRAVFMLSTTMAAFSGQGPLCLAADISPTEQVSPKVLPQRDINAIIERRRKRVTQQDREAASDRLKAQSPAVAARIDEIRARLTEAAETRISELEKLNNTIVPVTGNAMTVGGQNE